MKRHKTMKLQKIKIELKNRDCIEVEFCVENNILKEFKTKIIACQNIEKEISKLKNYVGKNIEQLDLPTGNQHYEILIRELILKMQNKWDFPYKDYELCHCRKISAEDVDQAVISGCHKVEKIREFTWANTGCGTCLGDINKILDYRLTK